MRFVIYRVLALSLTPLPSILFDAILKLIKCEIDSLLGHQFCMISNFPDSPLMENNDPIRMLNSRKSVSDDKRCPSFK